MASIPFVLGIILGVVISRKFSRNSSSQGEKSTPDSLDHVGTESPLSKKSIEEMGSEEFDRFLNTMGEKDVTPLEIENLFEVYNEIVPKIDQRIKSIQETIDQLNKVSSDSEPPENIKEHIRQEYNVEVNSKDDILQVLNDLKDADDRKWGLLKSFLKKVDFEGHEFVDDRSDYRHSELVKQLKHR